MATEEEQAEETLRKWAESKATIPQLFIQVIKADDTLRCGNVTMEELGMPNLPVRTDVKLATFCQDIANQNEWGKYFKQCATNTTDTSLSKDGFLLRLAVTTKKEVEDSTKPRKQNSGWFHKKDKSEVNP